MSPIVLGTPPLATLLEVVLALVLFALGVHFVRALLRDSPWVARRTCNDDLACARCGYGLRGLELPRCPECGTLRGFTVPLQDLGLSETELRESFASARARRAADPTARTPPPATPSPSGPTPALAPPPPPRETHHTDRFGEQTWPTNRTSGS